MGDRKAGGKEGGMPSDRSTRSTPGVCGACEARVNHNFAPGIKCSGGCNIWYHGNCVDPKLSAENISAFKIGKFSWVCEQCFKREGGNFNSTRVVNRTINLGRLDEVMEMDFAALVARCDSLEKENTALRAMITALSSRVGALEARDLNRPSTSPHITMGGVSYHWPVGQLDSSIDSELAQQPDEHVGDVAGQPPGGSGPADSRKRNGPKPRSAVENSKHKNSLRAGSGGVNERLPTVPRYKWLFVTRVANSLPTEQFVDFVAERLSTGRRPKCIRLTKAPLDDPVRRIASFRIQLEPSEYREATEEGFWPNGVFFNEYRFLPRLHSDQGGGPRTAE